MANSNSLNEQDRADLIAYLDGELDPRASEAVESKLHTDAKVRAEAESLRMTWDLLDYLPRPEPSPNFTHRTMSQLSLMTSTRAPVKQRRHWLQRIGWTAAVIAAVGIGYAVTGWAMPRKDGNLTDEQVNSLVKNSDARVKDRVEVYRRFNDLQFFIELDRPELFGGDGTDPIIAELKRILAQLDPRFYKEDPVTQARVSRVLDRFADWLESLSAESRDAIEKPLDPRRRLDLTRNIREQQWVDRLPKAQQDIIRQAPQKDRAKLIQALWQAELDRRADWQVSLRFWDVLEKDDKPLPCRLDEFANAAELKKYVARNLLPLLDDEERKRLKDAEGKWPTYPRLLVELADSHPVSLLGPVYVHIDDLPDGIKAQLKTKATKPPSSIKPPPARPENPKDKPKDKGKKDKGKDKGKKEKGNSEFASLLEKADNKWPDFCQILVEFHTVNRKGKPKEPKLAKELKQIKMPSHAGDFDNKEVGAFIEKKLLPLLDAEERVRITSKEGKWPAYPQAVLELARAHNLHIPSESLPAPKDQPDYWDRYRARPLTIVDPSASNRLARQ